MITRILIAANVLAYLWEIWYAGPGMLSAFGSDALQKVYDAGAVSPAVVQTGEWWRVVTAAFLHAGLAHIALNMVSLYSLGRFIEAIAGSARMFAIYVVSMIVSSLAAIFFTPSGYGTIGASGAIFGLFGALFAIGFKLGPNGMRLVRDNLGILVLNLLMTFTIPAISKSAHVGGLIAGFILTYAIYFPPRPVRAAVVDASTGDAYDAEYQAPASGEQ